MEVAFSNSFKKAFKKRVKMTELEPEFWIRLELFISEPFAPQLKTHKLTGKLKDLWSFSVDYDLRVIFYFTEDKSQKAFFVDIGTHKEVY